MQHLGNDMTNEQKNRYEAMKRMAKEELDHLDKELNEEVIRAKQKIEELQKAKKAVKQIYDNTCALLGVKSVIEMKDYGLDVEKPA
jgi:RNA-splicing ligase RtcB